MKVAAVIPVGPGRDENLTLVLDHLLEQCEPLAGVMVVGDGFDPRHMVRRGNHFERFRLGAGIPIWSLPAPKHEPGMEQPRNRGVRALQQVLPETTHVWFCDSDVIVLPTALAAFKERWLEESKRATFDIAVGPYEWLPEGMREIHKEIKNDPRWWSFENRVVSGDMSDGLACFSGNLMWEIGAFTQIGGFWNEIHHARCEDGELGLRAIAHGCKVLFVPRARGFHLCHPVDYEAAVAKNTRDVPMLNARHPWVEQHGMFVAERDGRRFEQRCEHCGESVNTVEWWEHMRRHEAYSEGLSAGSMNPNALH